jgi:hypothetical protein
VWFDATSVERRHFSMRRILALAMVTGVLVGGGAALASANGSTKSHATKTGRTPAAKTPVNTMMPHHCHGTASNKGLGL